MQHVLDDALSRALRNSLLLYLFSVPQQPCKSIRGSGSWACSSARRTLAREQRMASPSMCLHGKSSKLSLRSGHPAFLLQMRVTLLPDMQVFQHSWFQPYFSFLFLFCNSSCTPDPRFIYVADHDKCASDRMCYVYHIKTFFANERTFIQWLSAAVRRPLSVYL